MEHKELIERIIKDANAEAKRIVDLATKTAKANVDYAKKNAEEITLAAKENAKKAKARDAQIIQGANEIRARLYTLEQKTDIVDSIFERAFKQIKYNFRTEQKPNYELRMTRDELMADLRDAIENEVFKILWT